MEMDIEDRERIQKIRHAGAGVPDSLVLHCIMHGVPVVESLSLFDQYRQRGHASRGQVHWGEAATADIPLDPFAPQVEADSATR